MRAKAGSFLADARRAPKASNEQHPMNEQNTSADTTEPKPIHKVKWSIPLPGFFQTFSEKQFWTRMAKIMRAGKPIPKLKPDESTMFSAIIKRHADYAAKLTYLDLGRYMAGARAWAYRNVKGFQRHHGLPLPEMMEWARANFPIADAAGWLAEAKRCHETRPIDLGNHYNTEPITEETVGRPVKIASRLSEA